MAGAELAQPARATITLLRASLVDGAALGAAGERGGAAEPRAALRIGLASRVCRRAEGRTAQPRLAGAFATISSSVARGAGDAAARRAAQRTGAAQARATIGRLRARLTGMAAAPIRAAILQTALRAAHRGARAAFTRRAAAARPVGSTLAVAAVAVEEAALSGGAAGEQALASGARALTTLGARTARAPQRGAGRWRRHHRRAASRQQQEESAEPHLHTIS